MVHNPTNRASHSSAAHKDYTLGLWRELNPDTYFQLMGYNLNLLLSRVIFIPLSGQAFRFDYNIQKQLHA